MLYGFADLNRDMSATRAESAQLRQEAVRNDVALVKAQSDVDMLKRDVEAVYSQVKELRWVVEGPPELREGK